MFKNIPGLALIAAAPAIALADGGHSHQAIHQTGAVVSAENSEIDQSFDILAAHVHREGRIVTFHMTLKGTAGETVPERHGDLGGAPVLSYVWPTSLSPETVGFEADGGILALAATSHPDFDDTPLFDEDGDGDVGNDGANWHSHWVVLAPNEACGDGALGVKDIPEGTTPNMPATWPGLPIYIDSPGYTPVLKAEEITINVGFEDPAVVENMSYDGVTSALRVNQSIHAPLLCVVDVFDVASGDLSLPGRVE
ncbi:hypothetical protein E1180_01170 [Roseibium denhamense]|uniref:Uncharacterized protein n=1 Tax=Roseibium denhamense TaxID=76305 RepID=A0ABY1NFM1_9HYPH|nr:hypothetical protein [Roseibium denhamense]MTI04127.1 hypothetical protein [Roseibium denhamense]SMP08159.1 hypothetical protein SAMN06265374_0937 [Roseibium denhamense]